MTRGELRELVWQWVDDELGGYFQAPLVNTLLNNAQKETQKRLVQAGEDYYVVGVETTTVQNQKIYVLPSDFLKLRRLELNTGGTYPNEYNRRLEYITFNEQGLVSPNVSSPTNYTIIKNKLHLYPIPDNAYPLKLWYEYRVVDMVNDNDVPDVPEEFHEYLAVLAAWDCFIKDDRANTNIQEKKAMYETLLKQMAQDRDESAPRHVVITQNDGYTNLF